MNVYNVESFKIGVVTRKGDDEVHEAWTTHDAINEQQALNQMKTRYDEIEWDVIRVRFIQKNLGPL